MLGPVCAERSQAVVDWTFSDKCCNLSPDKMSKQNLLVSHCAKLRNSIARQTRTQDEKFTDTITDTDFVRVGCNHCGSDMLSGPGAPHA